jgi:thioredoxin reductase (NADPH)
VDIPILVVVDDDPGTLDVVEGELRKRYGADYEIISAGSADDPVRLLAELRDQQRPVSVVLAAQSLSGMTGTRLLAQVRQFHPAAKYRLGLRAGAGRDPAGHRARPHR